MWVLVTSVVSLVGGCCCGKASVAFQEMVVVVVVDYSGEEGLGCCCSCSTAEQQVSIAMSGVVLVLFAWLALVEMVVAGVVVVESW